MKKIAIYGAGGFGRETACLIQKINDVKKEWELIGFFDDNPSLKGQMISHYAQCLGGIDELNSFQSSLSVVITIGTPHVVQKIVSKITNPFVVFPNIIHPDLILVDPDTFIIGRGNIILGRCAMSCDVKIGDFNILDGSVTFGHDVKVGNYNTFMPAGRISGEVMIGDCNFFGVGCIVLQQIKVGNKVRLGAGSVLMTKPKNDCLYIGNPAKKTIF